MQVAQLRVENTTLIKRLTEIGQKYNEAAVDNRILKADVEALRAKVRIMMHMTGVQDINNPEMDKEKVNTRQDIPNCLPLQSDPCTFLAMHIPYHSAAPFGCDSFAVACVDLAQGFAAMVILDSSVVFQRVVPLFQRMVVLFR